MKMKMRIVIHSDKNEAKFVLASYNTFHHHSCCELPCRKTSIFVNVYEVSLLFRMFIQKEAEPLIHFPLSLHTVVLPTYLLLNWNSL